MRLVECNADLDIFLTLTFAENLTNIEIANNLFNKFIKRLRSVKDDIRYIAVPEFQQRGAVHYHVLMSGKYFPKAQLEKIWGHGFIKLKSIKQVEKLGKYISKYLTKEMFDQLRGKKKFFTSRGIIKPTTLYSDDAVSKYVEAPLELISNYTFSAPWVGSIQKKIYKQII